MNEAQHCGNCENDCTQYEGVTGTCSEGQCIFTAALCKDETDSSGNVTKHKKICIIDSNPVCEDIDNDPNNCGECDKKCDGDKPVCVAGECGNQVCSYTFCDGNCVDLDRTDEHCGDCHTSCDKETQRCINGICSAKSCLDSCTKAEIIALGIGEEEFKTLFGDVKSVCIDPGEPSLCGMQTCADLKNALQATQKIGCSGDLICQRMNDNTYSCSCPNGTFKHETQCLNPSDNRSCGATATDPGNKCTAETGYCDPEKHTCSLCVGGTIACNTGNEGSPSIKCIDPETSKDFVVQMWLVTNM